MTIRPILRFPDVRLRTPADPVTAFDGALASLAADLVDTMRAAPGVGITGPHIGVLQAITVIEIAPSAGPRIFVNPVVVSASRETIRQREGSVSMPGFTDEVERPARVDVRYQTLDGLWQNLEADGWMSACLQHEIDQINGIFWLYRLSRLKRERLVKTYEKGLKLG
ncbi:peptide deformylase [Rhizobium sp. Leaf384]|uniref:peptide deformylase n=1 Tax=unclassified Rhizobium TaxID=2613769 RepID=UPI000714AB29|nr:MULTISPECIES: peptide deformylase [unclassified Rhizobium]KQS74509.1 peptide deformylase [Rhizobium sp. Leaf383]KQS80247.1 peptide deformylase [Rhizobium sp. Leaf384]